MRFLFATWDGGGNVPPTLVIARRLVARGHSVRILAPRSLLPSIAAAGCAFTPYRCVPSGMPTAAGSTGGGRIRASLLALELARAAPVLAFAEDVLDEVARTRPNVLVVDFMLGGAVAAAERAGLPTAALMHTVYCLRPGFGAAWKRGSSSPLVLRDGAVSSVVRARTRRRLGELNEARRILGLDPVDSAAAQLASLARVLVLTTEAFDPPPAAGIPPNVRYVGPQVDESSDGEEALCLPWPDDDPRPLALVSFSTRFASPGVVQRVLDGLAGLPVRTLLTVGSALSQDELRVSADLVVRRFVPHSAVLPRARLVVTHGGLGTIMSSLAHGVPLICIPLKNDQFENAARVVAAGAGLQVGRWALRRSLRRAVSELLSEPRFAESARRVARDIAVYGDAAADELEECANDHPSRARRSSAPRESSVRCGVSSRAEYTPGSASVL